MKISRRTSGRSPVGRSPLAPAACFPPVVAQQVIARRTLASRPTPKNVLIIYLDVRRTALQATLTSVE
jgi:hypothetical protein